VISLGVAGRDEARPSRRGLYLGAAIGLPQPDVVNRALQVCAVVQAAKDAGAEILVRWSDGEVGRLTIEESGS
jgi:hypothetical protein